LRASANAGAGWNLTRLTSNNGSSAFPSVAFSGTRVYVAYLDNSSGNDQLYIAFSSLK